MNRDYSHRRHEPTSIGTASVCGCSVKWSCGTDEYPTGRADCEDGRMVSLRLGTGPSCPWPGATVFRLLGQVYVPMPLVTK